MMETQYRIGDRVVDVLYASGHPLKVVGVSRSGEILFVHLDVVKWSEHYEVFEIDADDVRLVERSVRR